MRATRRRKKRRAAELTPLIDVLFILLFAALVQTQNAASKRPTDVADAGADAGAGIDAGTDAAVIDARADDAARPSTSPASYRQRSLRTAEIMASAIEDRDVVTLEISIDGVLQTITHWRDGRRRGYDEVLRPLLREVPATESDFELTYRGDTDEQHRVCSIVRDHLPPSRESDGGAILLIVTDGPPRDWPFALRRGLEADVKRCFNDARAVAILLKPPSDVDEQP